MAPPTKKRKLSEPKSNADLADVAQDFFRKHFESQFAPLPEAQSTRQQRTCQEEETAEKSTSEDEWSGIDSQDDEEDKEQVEVVDYSSVDYYHLNGEGRMEKKERRAFMSSRPPSATNDNPKPIQPTSSSKKKSTLPEDSASLLAQDMALHRLITESHLLSQHSAHSSSYASHSARPFSGGKLRVATTEMRIKQLSGSAKSEDKGSVLARPRNMPMSIRKGIERAEAEREEKRRREARTEGLVLERKGGKGKERRKGKKGGGDGGSGPGIGIRGSELRLSKNEIRRMEGPKDERSGKGKKRRR